MLVPYIHWSSTSRLRRTVSCGSQFNSSKLADLYGYLTTPCGSVIAGSTLLVLKPARLGMDREPILGGGGLAGGAFSGNSYMRTNKIK